MQANAESEPDADTPPTTDSGHPLSGDRYRARWRWDSVVKGTHLLHCWYQRSCSYNVYPWRKGSRVPTSGGGHRRPSEPHTEPAPSCIRDVV